MAIAPPRKVEAPPPTKEYTGVYLYDPVMKDVPPGTYVGPGGVRVRAETYREAQAKLARQFKEKAELEKAQKELVAQERAKSEEVKARKAYVASLERLEKRKAVEAARPAPREYRPYAPITPTPIRPPPVSEARAEVREALGLRREKVERVIERPGEIPKGLEPAYVAPKPPKEEIRAQTIAERVEYRTVAGISKVSPFVAGIARESFETGKGIAADPLPTAIVAGAATLVSLTPPGRAIVGGAMGVSVVHRAYTKGPEAAISDILLLGAAAKAGPLIAGVGRRTRPPISLETAIGEARLKDVPVPEGLVRGVGVSKFRRGDIVVETKVKEYTAFVKKPKGVKEIKEGPVTVSVETPEGIASITRGVGERVVLDAPKQKVLEVKGLGKRLKVIGPEPAKPREISREPISTKIAAITTPSPVKGVSRFEAEMKTKIGTEITTEKYIGTAKEIAKYPTKKGMISVADTLAIRTKPVDKELAVSLGVSDFKTPAKLGLPFRIGEPKKISFEGLGVTKTKALKKIRKEKRRERKWEEFVSGEPPVPTPKKKAKDLFELAREKREAKMFTFLERVTPTVKPPREGAMPGISAPKEPAPIAALKPEEVALYDKPMPSFAQLSAHEIGLKGISAPMPTGLGPMPLIRPPREKVREELRVENGYLAGERVDRPVIEVSKERAIPKAKPERPDLAVKPITTVEPIYKPIQRPDITIMPITTQYPEQKITPIQAIKAKKAEKMKPTAKPPARPTLPGIPPRRPPGIPRLPRIAIGIRRPRERKPRIKPPTVKLKTPKIGIKPLADWLSVTQAAARKPGITPLHKAPTAKVKREFIAARARKPLSFRFATANDLNKRRKKQDLTIDIPKARKEGVKKLLDWKDKKGRRFI